MNSKILSLYAAVSLGLLVSCANDDTSSDQNQQGVNEKNILCGDVRTNKC